ncbi:hypothetical protein D9M71_563230 [compost metagenome]
MNRLRTLRIDAALDDRDDRLALLVEQGLARPQRLPLRIVHLAAQTGGLGMLVEAEAGHGIEVALDRHEAVQGRPQAVAAHRQDQGFQLPVGGLHQIDGGKALATLDRGDVLLATERVGQLGILGCLERIEGRSIQLVGEPAGLQVDHARTDAAGEQLLDLLAGHFGLTQTGNGQDAALLVQLTVLDLGRLQRHGGAGDEHRAHQADHQRHHQGAGSRLFLTRHCVPASA